MNCLVVASRSANDQDGSCLCFPKKSLVATAFDLKSFKLGKPVRSVIDDHDAP